MLLFHHSAGDKHMSTESDRFAVYVSPDGNDHWSGRRADPQENDGPLKSLKAARNKIRQDRPDLQVPACVYLRGGRYKTEETLILTARDGNIAFQAFEHEEPILDAGSRITGWRVESLKGKKVWTADVSAIIDKEGYFRQLFANGNRAQRARLPGKGYYWMEDVPGVDKNETNNRAKVQKREFIAAAGDFSNFRNITDCDVVVMHWWLEDRRPVASFDASTRKVTLQDGTLFTLVDDLDAHYAKYYVDNVFEGLNEPGQWYCDREAKKLYYLPRAGETVADTQVFAAGPSQFVRIEGAPEERQIVRGISFKEITFEHNDWREYNYSSQSANLLPGTIFMVGAKDCSIENCRIRHNGINAIEINHGSSDCRIIGNTIEDMGAGGIKLNGANAYGSRCARTQRITMSDNHIHALGRVHHGAAGIVMKHSAGNLVSHNEIHDIYYTGISCGWVWGYWDSVSHDNRIEYNHIYDIGQGMLNDMGAIYTLGVSPGTAIRNNIIHNVRGAKYGGWAIYPDEGSSHMVIENNICYDCASQLFHLHFGRENVLRNNIWAFAGEGLIAISRGNDCDLPRKGALPDGRVSNAFTFERNIVITDGAPVFLGGMEKETCNDETGNLEMHSFISDMNLFFDVGGKPITAANGGHRIEKEGYFRTFGWKQWQDMGFDHYSVIADPKCADIARRDFALADDSPALKLGFRKIDISCVGPRPAAERNYVENEYKEDTEKKP
ncbi:MAG: hypothetical protein GF398_20085 [Chitinivibrionales bacterium]|nr:hypothetical protein [Chitinivibrionales bacterium]